jgi:type I restriction enzyme S subunit
MRSEQRTDWQTITVGELIEAGRIVIGDGYRAKNVELGDVGIPFARAGNVRSGFAFEGADRLLPERVAYVGHKMSQPGDVVFTSKGTVGRFGFVTSKTPEFIYSPQLCFWRIQNGCEMDPRFLYFWMHGNECARQFNALKGQTDMADYVSLRDQHTIEIRLPSSTEQRAIGLILATLDGKIDGNWQLASLFEEAATISFRAWFVDFVGVGNFEEWESVRVPMGWDVGSLTDLARFVNGRAFTKDANGQGRPILRIKELNSGIGGGTPRTDKEVVDDNLARDGDMLFAWSGSLAAYRWAGPESVINQHIFKVIPDGWPTWFVYGWLQEHMAAFQAIARDKATTMGHIQRHHLTEAVVALPDAGALTGADDVLGSLDKQRAMFVKEAMTLGEIRDALLPKLISGEIRVPDTTDPEEVIGPAAEALAGAGT